MSQNKHRSVEMRRSPVSTQKQAGVARNKTPKGKSKTSSTSRSTPGKAPGLSNGVHNPTSNGVTVVSNGEDETAKMNLLTLQKVDPSVCSILATVPHVVLYEFKPTENVWVSVVCVLL